MDKGLHGRNVLYTSVVNDSATYLLTISYPDIDNIAMSLYDIIKYTIHAVAMAVERKCLPHHKLQS